MYVCMRHLRLATFARNHICKNFPIIEGVSKIRYILAFNFQGSVMYLREIISFHC